MKNANSKGSKRALRKMVRSAKQSRKKSPKRIVYVVVVMRSITAPLGGIVLSCRAPFGDWSSFVGEDRDEVVGRAMEAVRKWGQYEIWTGTLTGKVVVPTNFKLVAL